MLGKNKDCPFLKFECFEHAKHFWFVSNFEHVNFAIKIFFKEKNDNPNYYASLMIF